MWKWVGAGSARKRQRAATGRGRSEALNSKALLDMNVGTFETEGTAVHCRKSVGVEAAEPLPCKRIRRGM
jgi:hypothetical protein